MDRFQILKGEKPPTVEEVKFEKDKEKLKNLTDAYELMPKMNKTCKNCFEYQAACETLSDGASKSCKFW